MTKETPSTPPKTVDEYLLAQPEAVRAALENLRQIIRSAIPGVEEAISYRIPTFKYKGRPLVGMAAFANHCGFYVMSPPLMPMFKEELKSLDSSGATIRFTVDKPLPAGLVVRIVEARIAAQETRVGKSKLKG